MSILQLLWRYLLWLSDWVKPRLVWVILLFLGATLAVVFVGQKELHIRWWGMVLQLVGIGTVVADLFQTQAKFGREMFREWWRNWLRRRPGHELTAVGSEFQGNYNVGLRGHGRGRGVPGPGATFEERLQALEHDIGYVSASLGQMQQDLDSERRARESADNEESLRRAQGHNELDRKLEEVAVGSMPLALFGILWLAAGVILSSTSPEVAAGVKALMK